MPLPLHVQSVQSWTYQQNKDSQMKYNFFFFTFFGVAAWWKDLNVPVSCDLLKGNWSSLWSQVLEKGILIPRRTWCLIQWNLLEWQLYVFAIHPSCLCTGVCVKACSMSCSLSFECPSAAFSVYPISSAFWGDTGSFMHWYIFSETQPAAFDVKRWCRWRKLVSNRISFVKELQFKWLLFTHAICPQ